MYQRLLGDDNIFPAAGSGGEGWEREGGERSEVQSKFTLLLYYVKCLRTLME